MPAVEGEASMSIMADSMKKQVAILDLLNLSRCHLMKATTNTVFASAEEFAGYIRQVAIQLHGSGTFHKVYIITKFVRFSEHNTFGDFVRFILWNFAVAVPDAKTRYVLVVAQTFNYGSETILSADETEKISHAHTDKGADDRALFILYEDLTKITKSSLTIFSNDKFRDIDQHANLPLNMIFYRLDIISVDSLEETTIVRTCPSRIFCRGNVNTAGVHICDLC